MQRAFQFLVFHSDGHKLAYTKMIFNDEPTQYGRSDTFDYRLANGSVVVQFQQRLRSWGPDQMIKKCSRTRAFFTFDQMGLR